MFSVYKTFVIATNGNSQTGLLDTPDILDSCLGIAIGGNHKCFVDGKQPTSLELAKLCLKVGANPNGYCFEDNEDSRRNHEQGIHAEQFTPALYQAIQNDDADMVKLLLQFGADPKASARVSQTMEDGSQQITTSSIQSKAEEMKMMHLFDSNNKMEMVEAVNPKAFLAELGRGILAPIREIAVQDSSPLVVATMRATGRVPPVGVLSMAVMEYCYGVHDVHKVLGVE